MSKRTLEILERCKRATKDGNEKGMLVSRSPSPVDVRNLALNTVQLDLLTPVQCEPNDLPIDSDACYENLRPVREVVDAALNYPSCSNSENSPVIIPLNETNSVRDEFEIIERIDSDISEDSDDSVCDRDYVPIEENSDSSENGIDENPAGHFTVESNKRVGGGRKTTLEEDRTRKRVRREKEWKENVRKEKKERGEEYISKKQKVKSAKRLKESCKCRKKCFEKFDDLFRTKLFKDFYGLSRNGQDQFIAETIKESQKYRERLRQDNDNGDRVSRRKYTRKYYITNSIGQDIEVCQTMYLNTFDITLKKVRVIIEKKRYSGTNICSRDGRGKHNNHKKISAERKNSIREHISSFPSYSSHYSRERTSKKYLSPDLSIALMYRLYREYCQNNNIDPERECQYRKIFNEEFNLAFHTPANDTCAKCDKFNISLRSFEAKELSSDEQETKKQLEFERKQHLDMAEAAYKQKAADKERSKQDSSFIVCSFDLEKCLPTPYLRNSISFYKRQLWTFNLTVYHTTVTGSIGTCFLWNETIAGRGGQEIASCIRKFVLTLPDSVRVLNLYSDSCSGQNRNIHMCTMFCVLMSELKRQGRHLQEINHFFMEPGHSHMEADTIHAAIETAKKKTNSAIEVPHDWTNFIRNIRRTPPLRVVEMTQTDFLNFGSLLSGKLVHRKKNEDGDMISWMTIKWMKFCQNDEFQMFYKNSFGVENAKKIDLRRGSVRKRDAGLAIATEDLKPLNIEPLPLAELKIMNLLELLPFISEYNRPYYENLRPSTNLEADDIPDPDGDLDTTE